MRHVVVLCAVLCVFAGCASSNPSQKPIKPGDPRLITLPQSDSLFFLGVSGPQLKHEQEIDTAREDAAKKAAMYHGLEASVVNIQSIGTNSLDYYVDTGFSMKYDTQLERYTDRLTFDPKKDVFNCEGSVFIRFSYPAVFPGIIDYTSVKNPDGSPEWTKRPPMEINGFMAAAGFARRQFRMRDTIAKSSEAAIAALVSRSSSFVRTSDTLINQQNTSSIYQQSQGRLQYFIVLETWIDPENLSVWTLAVARSSN